MLLATMSTGEVILCALFTICATIVILVKE